MKRNNPLYCELSNLWSLFQLVKADTESFILYVGYEIVKNNCDIKIALAVRLYTPKMLIKLSSDRNGKLEPI